MALSNIFNEPKKEIIETLVGATVIIPLILLDYYFALWFEKVSDTPWVLSMTVIGPTVLCSIIFFIFLIHILGEFFVEKVLDWDL